MEENRVEFTYSLELTIKNYRNQGLATAYANDSKLARRTKGSRTYRIDLTSLIEVSACPADWPYRAWVSREIGITPIIAIASKRVRTEPPLHPKKKETIFGDKGKAIALEIRVKTSNPMAPCDSIEIIPIYDTKNS